MQNRKPKTLQAKTTGSQQIQQLNTTKSRQHHRQTMQTASNLSSQTHHATNTQNTYIISKVNKRLYIHEGQPTM